MHGLAKNGIISKITQGKFAYELARENDNPASIVCEANYSFQEHSLVTYEIANNTILQKEITDSLEYIFHEVQSFESIYSISSKYGLKDSIIFWHNKYLRGNPVLSKGQIIKLPKYFTRTSRDCITIGNVGKPKYEMYIIKKRDTPKSLTKKWGMFSLDKFYTLNPEARVKWFKGMKLLKPLSQNIVNYEFGTEETRLLDDLAHKNDIFNIACVLPFFIDQYVNQGPGKKRSELTFSYRQGIEYAIYLFSKRTKAKCEVSFYDSMNHKDTVGKLIASLYDKRPDIILGPLYSSRILQFSGSELEAITVNLISRQESIESTNIWNNIVSEDIFWLSILKRHRSRKKQQFSKNQKSSRKLLIVGLDYGDSKKTSQFLMDSLEGNEFFLCEGDDSWAHHEKLGGLDTTIIYDLAITSNDPAYILDVLRNLRSVNLNYQWLTHEYQALNNGIFNDVFAKEQVTLFTSNYTDYSQVDVLEFIDGFRKYFNREPDKHSMEAYDNTMYHLLRLFDGRTNWRGVRKGFDFSEDGEKRNIYVESRRFRNLRWEL
ncbi:MAG: hypothetical protein VXY91_05840 [Bacteroidota bacterium]|nr:hypothetical protein [Bacteroidota bacterium]